MYMGVSMGSRQSIRRQRPNLMKLSGFVENFSLIILLILFFEFDCIFIRIWIKYFLTFSHIFAHFCKKNPNFHQKIDDNST
jgi:hypothetical protein